MLTPDQSSTQVYIKTGILSNIVFGVGFPAERYKIAAQLKLQVSTWQAVKPLLKSSPRHLITGASSSAMRHNAKFLYRTLLMRTMPNYIDTYELNVYSASAIKSVIACSLDTLIGSPFETIKVAQMKSFPNKISIHEAAKIIYATKGLPGFFTGTRATIAKSYPSWFYLFLGYHITQDKREKLNFAKTLAWAMLISIPITFATTPIDVVKTQQQAGLLPSTTLLKSMKHLVQQHGLFSLWRGASFRLLHKGLATAVGYSILDSNSKSASLKK